MNKNDLNKVEEGYYGNKEDYYDKQGHCYTSFFISDIIIDNKKQGSVTINNNFDISKEKKDFLKEELLKYFELEKNESLDDEELDNLIRFFVENLGAQFYIQGVIDSYKYIVEKSDNLLSVER
ncbi:MAG: DUF2164 family protein [Clostridium perfringens]|uniref:DUF2164 family protein n=1 Tax=Clostridium perfringens TaxID=1502 RepID=A0A133NF81_CLOPF|nr:DUF2164 family protein [Clostridium perfringens]EHP49556.1 hypothetical protein HMPREF9476_01009 [Clostridium perfringens WAL-14572]ELC8418300.1 DUF2164 family protein [Clostridium perfringens]KXA14952.1 hypothetical protein HMPREF3222_00028 [Clostridium perfringens]MBO3355164.1 DUF2164 family protein [Clostridium perfringens]MBO3358435.1 DUF2164 family protein [Clostridium perfringens]